MRLRTLLVTKLVLIGIPDIMRPGHQVISQWLLLLMLRSHCIHMVLLSRCRPLTAKY